MKFAQTFLAALVTLTALAPLALSPSVAYGQQYQNARSAPRIEGFNVDEVRRLTPGTELNFSLYGTPGGQAVLRIAGSTRNLVLSEVEAGQYEGSYIISSNDKIVARSPVTANLRVGNQVVSAVLDESLQVGVGYHNRKLMPGPQAKIERFKVDPVAELDGGTDLLFNLRGTPGGKADITIQGVRGKILLSEVDNGEYAGTYTIRNRDRVMPNSIVTANLRVGDRVASTTLNQSLLSAAVPAPVRPTHVCSNCGTVEAVNVVEVKGEGGYLGTIGGGVVGALLGHQVGGGNGKTAAEIAGAVGGAYAGRQIEANSRRVNHYEVLVRLQNGATQTVVFESDPGYRIGDKVKVSAGVITRLP